MLLTMPATTHPDPYARRVRRYRLARIQVGGQPSPVDRFQHLQRRYD